MPKNWENRLSELRALTAAIRDRNRLSSKYRSDGISERG